MRKLTAFIFSLCFLLLAGCNSQQQIKSLSLGASMKDAMSVIPEGAFRISEQENSDIDFHSYIHRSGTSSVNSRILIYRYDDYLVFAVAYQNGPESVMETYYLTRNQGEKFLNLVSDYQESEKTDNGLQRMGGDESEYLLTLNGKEHEVLPLDLSVLNLELTDKDVLFETNLTNDFTTANMNEYVKSSRIGMRDALLGSVRAQMKQITLSPIVSLLVNHVGEIDSIMTAVLEDGKEFQLLTTNDGCLIAVSERGNPDNPNANHGGK